MSSFYKFAAVAIALALTMPATLRGQNSAPIFNGTASSGYFVTPNYIRGGASILFNGRLLPADATGTISFSLDGIPVHTSTVAPQAASDYVAVGDSVTFAGYIGDPAQRYQTIVAAALNRTVSTYASNGYPACDTMLYNVVPNGLGLSRTTNPLYSLEVGAEETLTYGIGANEAIFDLCHQALIAWLGVARTSKTLVGDPNVAIRSGAWTSAPIFGGPLNGLTNSSGSGTVRFTLTTGGGSAYLWYLLQAGTPGTFSVSVDGGASSAATSTLFPPTTQETIPGAYALLRIAVAAGTHTFDIAAQSGTVSLAGMGTAPPAGAGSPLPTVLVTDVVTQQNTTIPATIAAYTSDIRSNVALLASDGLDIRFVPTEEYWLATPADTTSFAHPNALGLSEFAQAFLSVITPGAPVSAALNVAGASYSSAPLTPGSHYVTMVYSGDQKYAGATTSAGGMFYDPTSSTALATDSTIYPTLTPVTLTATIPNQNADGLMNFYDVSGATPALLGSIWTGQTTAQRAVLALPGGLTAGQHTLMAQYAGDAFNAPSASPSITILVSGSYTTTTLTSPATRYLGGATESFTATVAPASASGNVTFYDGKTALATLPVAAGVARFSTTALADGIHSITAAYGGNGTENNSTSPVLAVEIDASPVTVSIAPLPASTPYGTALTFTASVSPAAATGTVTFKDGATTLAAPSLVNGVATLSLATLAVGSHSITAVYSGDSFDAPAVSSAVAAQITLDTPALTFVGEAPLAYSTSNIRYGAPIFFSGRILPADATGTLAFALDGTPFQTVPVTSQANSDYFAFGDSITAGTYLPTPSVRYYGILGQIYNRETMTTAVPGYTVCQVMPVEILPFDFGDTLSANPLYSLMIGTNDLMFYGTGAHEADFNLCHRTALTWLGVPRAAKVLVGDPGLATTAGSWSQTPASTGCCLNVLSAASAGSTLRFTLTTNGAPAYLWYQLQAIPGSFTLNVDGRPATGSTSTQFTSTELAATSYGVLRVPVSAGVHSFDITAAGGAVGVLGMGAQSTTVPSPTTLASDVPNQQNGNTAGIAQYTSDIQANINLLHADGLDIRFVPTQNYMHGTAAEMIDNLHPNVLGQAELAQAFEATISTTGPLAAPVIAATGSFTASTIPNGAHTMAMTYSGDQKYASATQLWPFSIYDGTSTVTLASDAQTYAAQALVTLTATVPQANNSGETDFYDVTASGNVLIGSAWLYAGDYTLSTSSLAAGAHTLLAQYLGSSIFYGSTSATIAIVITSPTITTLTASTNPAIVAAPIVFTATLSSTAATGTVTFFDGASSIGSASVSHGSASFTSSTLALGVHSLHAVYSGDTANGASTSATLAESVTAAVSTTTLALAQASVPAGAQITVNVRVATSSFTPTGTVTIRSGASTLASGTLANGSSGAAYATLSFNSAGLGVGTFPLVAFYSGDTDDQLSDSSATPVSVMVTGIPVSAALKLSGTQIPIQGTAVVTVTVAAATGIPTGSITFLSDGIAIGTATLTASGSATFNFSGTGVGGYLISASYTPTGLFAAATVPAQTLTVTAPLTSAFNPTSVQLAPGASTTTALTLTPLSGFAGAIQTVCLSSVTFVTCSLNAPATLAGPTSIPVTISVTRTSSELKKPVTLLGFALLLPLLGLRRLRPRARRSLARCIALCLTLACALALGGCANGGDFSSVPTGPRTVAITVTAAGIANTVNLTVNVLQ